MAKTHRVLTPKRTRAQMTEAVYKIIAASAEPMLASEIQAHPESRMNAGQIAPALNALQRDGRIKTERIRRARGTFTGYAVVEPKAGANGAARAPGTIHVDSPAGKWIAGQEGAASANGAPAGEPEDRIARLLADLAEALDERMACLGTLRGAVEAHCAQVGKPYREVLRTEVVGLLQEALEG